MNKFPIIVLCTALLCANSAHADDEMSAFGLALGQDFSVPECTKASYGYSIGTNHVCFEWLFGAEKESQPIVTKTVLVRFPIIDSPSIVKGGSLLARVIDGKLEGLSFNTLGTRNANNVLSKLKEKYGEPTAFLPLSVKNKLGATFEAFAASWHRPNLKVFFNSVSGSLDSGVVQIDTKKGSDDRSKEIKELTKDKRPL